MCDCIENINEMLAEKNARLSLTLTLSSSSRAGPSEYPHIPIEKLDKSKRGKVPTCFIPTFCPFCGERYVPETKEGGAS